MKIYEILIKNFIYLTVSIVSNKITLLWDLNKRSVFRWIFVC